MATNFSPPKTVLVDVDMCGGKPMTDAEQPYVIRSFKDTHGPNSTDVFEIWDFRPEAERVAGSLASLETITEQRLVLRSAEPGKKAELALVMKKYTAEGDCCGFNPGIEPHWRAHLMSWTKSGWLAGGTLLALVDDTKLLVIEYGYLSVQYGISGKWLVGSCNRSIGQFAPVLRIPTDLVTDEVLAQANEQGLRVYRDHEDCRIYPEPIGKGWKFPQHIDVGVLHLAGAEAGGRRSGREGTAIVIAGLKGERLRILQMGDPDYELTCGTHAWLSAPHQVLSVMVDVEMENGLDVRRDCLIRRHQLEVSDDWITIGETELWRGRPDGLPVHMSKFTEAVDAAMSKAKAAYCREIIYAQGIRPV